MSLNWDATRVEGIDNLSENDRVTLDALIWASIPVGLTEITEDNAFEFFQRLSFHEKIGGACRNNVEDDKIVPLFFEAGDVKRFIGLHTNVTRKTRAQFYKDSYCFHERWGPQRAKFDEAPVKSVPDEEAVSV